MSAESTSDSREAIASPGPDSRSQDGGPAIAAASKPANARPRGRTKKPRPCFEDGALTRVFKFPCKTFPRSSYYVTSDEIIIRIKKARKRWKLVVPKKRIVSYRTNRWFAKPRWVEIELTFTQASRLGLVAPRPAAAKDAAQGLPAAPPGGDDSEAARAPLAAGTPMALADSGEQDAYGQTVLKLGPEPDEIEPEGVDETVEDVEAVEAAAIATVEVIAVAVAVDEAQSWAGEAEAATALHSAEATVAVELAAEPVEVAVEVPVIAEPEVDTRPIVLPVEIPAESRQEPPLQSVPLIGGRANGASEMLPGAAARARSGTARRGYRVPVMLATLAFIMAGAAGGMLALREPTEVELAAAPRCPLTGPEALACAQPFETGSIDRGLPAAAPPPEREAPEAVASVETPAEIVAAPPPPPEVAADQSSGGTGGEVREDSTTLAHAAAIAAEPLPSLPTVEILPPEPLAPARAAALDPAACGELGVAADSIEIRFEYASAALDRVTLAMLRDFAGLMQACSAATVTIEGHTDSDGHADRNHALSLRRADAVREQLISAGTPAARIAVVAYGDTRPYAPNVSAENKRRNRRAAMVVQAP